MARASHSTRSGTLPPGVPLRLAMLTVLITACGPSVWDEPDKSDDFELLGKDEESEGVWVPPDAGESTTDSDIAVGAATWSSFVDTFVDLYCDALESCGYDYGGDECHALIDSFFDSSCSSYDSDVGEECLTSLATAACWEINDGSAFDECAPIMDSCTG